MSKLPKEVEAAMSRSPPPQVEEDKLDVVRQRAREAKEIGLRIAELEDQLSELKALSRQILETDLPELMGSVGIDRLGVPEHGNLPAFDVRLKTNVRAGIAKGWPDEKRKAAFDWLTKNGHSSLIKTDVIVSFERDARDEAMELVERLEASGILPEVDESVHASTLSSWLAGELKAGRPLPPLDLVGGIILTAAEIKERK